IRRCLNHLALRILPVMAIMGIILSFCHFLVTHTYTHTYTQTHERTYTHTHTHTHTLTHTYTHRHTHRLAITTTYVPTPQLRWTVFMLLTSSMKLMPVDFLYNLYDKKWNLRVEETKPI